MASMVELALALKRLLNGSFFHFYLLFWPILAKLDLLGLRSGASASLVLIKSWGKAAVFDCLTLSQIGFVLSELC